MKKVLILSILVLFLGSLFALESAPSDVVGFVKINLASNSWTAASLPFVFEDPDANGLDLSDVFGTQLDGNTPTDGDKVLSINTGQSAIYASAMGGWFPAEIAMDSKHGYWINRNTANATKDIYFCGKVTQEAIDYGTIAVGWTPVGIKEAGVVSIDDLDLVASGFSGTTPTDGDKILSINTGQSAIYATAMGGWFPAAFNIAPTHVYWINVNAAHTGFNWIYDPTSRTDGDSFFTPATYKPAVEKNITPRKIKKDAKK